MSARDTLAGRMGYVRADDAQVTPTEPLAPVEQAYPAIIVVQGRPAGESWLREHGAQLVLAFGFGVLALTVIAVVAVVVIAVVVAMVVGMVAIGVVAALAASGSSNGGSRGRR